MKNQIIKKIMAYLLVGAMVITTPMTASANELENAYAETGGGGEDNSNSNTDTNSNTNTQVIEPAIPITGPVKEENQVDIVGIVLEPDSLELKVDDTKYIQARVLFDNYDPSNEPMAWKATSIDYQTKQDIEINVRWKITGGDNDAAILSNEGVNTKLKVESQKRGKTEVTAWIDVDGDGEIDGGEHSATATIKVMGDVQNVIFTDKNNIVEKRTYDLKKYTKLVYGTDDTESLIGSGVNVVYSDLKTDVAANLKKCKLSEDGTLKVNKGVPAETVFTFTMVADNGKSATGTFKTVKPNPAKSVSISGLQSVTLGDNVQTLTATVTPTDSGNTTDEIIWTSSNKKIVEVVRDADEVEDNKSTATITAKAEGTATITAKATSGKSNKLKVTVTAAGVTVKILGAENATYTGKDTYLTAVITNEKGHTFQASSIKNFKWNVSDKKIAKITGKKDTAILKPVNDIKADSKDIDIVITGKTLKETKQPITVKQSNIADIEVGASYDEIGTIMGKGVKTPARDKTNLPVFVGMTYPYYAIAFNADGKADTDPAFNDAVGWSVSGSAATIDSNGKITPVKAGSATVKASYVTINDRGKAKLNSKSFKVKVTQNATAIAFAKAETVKNPSKNGKPQSVTLKVKATAPKKAALNVVDWKVMAYIASSETEGKEYTADEKDSTKPLSTKNGNAGQFLSNAKKNSVKVTIPGDAKPGSVIKVGAYTDGGAVAYAYIYVTEKTQRVTTAVSTGLSVSLGGTAEITGVKVTDTLEVAKPHTGFGTKGDTTAYITEPVTYSVDKTSAKYIKVDQNGKVTGLQKTGNKKATVTIKTISGKTAKVKVTVN